MESASELHYQMQKVFWCHRLQIKDREVICGVSNPSAAVLYTYLTAYL